jgi:hypothetical protein
MNRFIARFFAGIISIIHISTILALGASIFYYYSDHNSAIRQYLASNGVPEASFLLMMFGVFVGYVLLMGLLSTIVAINQNLEIMNSRS